MRIRYGVFVVLASTALSACGSAALDTDDQKASYGIGMDMGRNLGPAASHLDREAFLRGLEDAVEGREPAISSEEMREVYQRFTAMLQAEEEAQRGAASEKNAAEGAAYLAENGARDGVTTTASGLQYEVLREGDGPRPGPHDQVTIHYRGTLIDGTEFDSSYERGAPLTMGANQFVPGFSEGIQLMETGSQYRFVIPGDIGYGAQGSGGVIGPNATLIFEVELMEISQ